MWVRGEGGGPPGPTLEPVRRSKGATGMAHGQPPLWWAETLERQAGGGLQCLTREHLDSFGWSDACAQSALGNGLARFLPTSSTNVAMGSPPRGWPTLVPSTPQFLTHPGPQSPDQHLNGSVF